jgi:hypothetical protein
MSKNKELSNAVEIIERFGGIRPMANKIDVPVTTVQGWKKRDTIPGTRRQLILEAANANNIDLSDLVSDALSGGNVSSFKKPEEKEEKPATSFGQDNTKSSKETSAVPRASSSSASTPDKKSAYEPLQGIKPSEQILAEIEATEKKAFRKSLFMSLVIMVLVLGGAAALLFPQAKDVKQQVAQNSEQITGLEQDVASLDSELADVNESAGFLKNIIPEDIQTKFEGLQNQARNLQNTFSQLGQGDTGELATRVAQLEQKVEQLAQGAGFDSVVTRLNALEETLGGREQITDAITELRTIVDGLEGRVSDINTRLGEAPEDSALGQTLEGVEREDMQAAAMLIAFAQMRDALNREAPFEDDLALLQKLAGEDNVELQAALERLAPHADGGVLTTQGLSQEFRGLAGDIVVSSLKGEDISFADKAKARISEVLKVEKDGEMVNGTETQAVVSKAQALLDEGDVEGAIVVLQSLEGPAAEKASPFIEQAQTTALVQNVQVMVRDAILSKIPGTSGAPFSFDGSGSMDLNAIKKSIINAVPGRAVVTDEESGLSVLPQQKGFKGLTGSGQ